MTDMNKADRVRKIIKALLEKSVKNGATEEEAMNAAAKARELMDKYNVEIGAEELLKEEIKPTQTVFKRGDHSAFADYVAVVLAKLFDVDVIRREHLGVLEFVGHENDALLAKWTYEMLVDFVWAGAKAHLKTIPNANRRTKNHARRSYIIGAASRIMHRIDAMLKARAETIAEVRKGNSTALVVVDKSVAIRDYMKKHYNMSSHKPRTQSVSVFSYTAGQARGDAAQFNRPVNGGGPLAIGSR